MIKSTFSVIVFVYFCYLISGSIVLLLPQDSLNISHVLPPIIPANWTQLSQLRQQHPYNCMAKWDTSALTMTHGCEFSLSIDMDDLYSYGNHHYHHTPPLPYDAHTVYFQLSAHFQRVDSLLHRPLSLYLKISLGSFFIESIVLTEQQLEHSFAFTFPVIIPEVLTELFLHSEEYMNRFETMSSREMISLHIEYTVIYEENVMPLQNDEIDDVVLLQISQLSIDYLPPVKKYPLLKRSSVEIIASLSNHSLSDDHVIDNETLKKCDQLGLPHANVLNQIDITPNLSRFVHESMTSESEAVTPEQTLPQIFCGIFTTERQHEDNVRVRLTPPYTVPLRITPPLTSRLTGDQRHVEQEMHLFPRLQYSG